VRGRDAADTDGHRRSRAERAASAGTALGLGHGFMTDAALIETRNAQQIAVRFDDRHLDR
jgi:hypothetical protein